MLEEKKVFGQIEVTSNGIIFLKEYNQILKNGQVINSVPHRSSFTPDADINSLPDVVKPYAQLAWTEEVKQAYEAQKQASMVK